MVVPYPLYLFAVARQIVLAIVSLAAVVVVRQHRVFVGSFDRGTSHFAGGWFSDTWLLLLLLLRVAGNHRHGACPDRAPGNVQRMQLTGVNSRRQDGERLSIICGVLLDAARTGASEASPR